MDFNEFKPLLAPIEKPKLDTLQFPLLVSPKLDGIRAIYNAGELYSRNKIVLPNLNLSKMFGKIIQETVTKNNLILDGELIEGLPYEDNVYKNTYSKVMSKNENASNLTYWVFDICGYVGYKNTSTFIERQEYLEKLFNTDLKGINNIKFLPHVKVNNSIELMNCLNFSINKGFEGLILRNPSGTYKFDRATITDNIIYKLKRHSDAEAEILSLDGMTLICRILNSTKSINTVRLDLSKSKVKDLNKLIEKIKNVPIGTVIKIKFFDTNKKGEISHPIFVGFRNMNIDG